MKHWDPESAEKLIGIYSNRVSNVNVTSDGCALTFFSPNDLLYTKSLIEILMEYDQVSWKVEGNEGICVVFYWVEYNGKLFFSIRLDLH
jgi:hypothetical protein